MRLVWCVLSLAVGCDRSPAKGIPPTPHTESMYLVGVPPAEFHCDSLISIDTLGQLLGSTPRWIESTVSAPAGLPSPCTYLLNGAEAWTFDIDCRDGMKVRADALFEQYERTSAELSQLAAAEPHPSGKPDAGHPAHPPEPAHEVAVGARGLDHHGQGLLFIDDDAPCYVRVVGPDAERRLALARHLATALTPRTAPMAPRAPR